MTIPLTAAGFVGGVMFFGEMSMDPTKPIFVRTNDTASALPRFAHPSAFACY